MSVRSSCARQGLANWHVGELYVCQLCPEKRYLLVRIEAAIYENEFLCEGAAHATEYLPTMPPLELLPPNHKP